MRGDRNQHFSNSVIGEHSVCMAVASSVIVIGSKHLQCCVMDISYMTVQVQDCKENQSQSL
jgi:hypothetical protein